MKGRWMSLSNENSVGASGFVRTFVLIVLAVCSLRARAEDYSGGGLVDDKYSLKEDREAMDALRKNIPANVKKENDEKAFMDNMMTDLSVPPSDVRSKFQSIVNKKRESFSKDMTKSREDFYKAQTKEREAFTKEQGEKRVEFGKDKHSSSERTDFYDGLESKRKDFYEAQREKRDAFEETARDKRKNFDDYVRAKTDEFNQLHRDYTKRFEENKKTQADLKKAAAEKRNNLEQSLDQEYAPIRQKTPTQLGSEGE